MFKFKAVSDLDGKSNNNWLIDRLLPESSTCLVAGDPKTRKSWLAGELLVAIATGTDCFGTYKVLKQGRVMMIQGEDSEAIIKDRLESIAKVRGASLKSLANVSIVAGQNFALDNPEHFEALKSQVMLERPLLIIMDPLVRLIPNTAEGSTSQMSKILTKLRHLQRDSGTSIMLVHHNKTSKSKNAADNIRGSSDLRSWYDAAYFLTKPSNLVTQVEFEFKAFEEQPSLFFELKNLNGGLAPMMLTSPSDIKKFSNGEE
jgi:RecA-family ATPase